MTDTQKTLREGGRVRVIDTEDFAHPHSGKTGIITELLGVRLTGPGWKPRAMVRLDDNSGIAVISLKHLEPTP